MTLLVSPLLWTILALSAGVSVLFITGTRYLAYRVGGRPEMFPATSLGEFVISTPPAASLRWALRVSPLVLLLSAGTGILLLRFTYGLGSVTNLSNQYPLGIWIGFDVMCGVALAAGAFVMAATAHIFRIERFEPLVRPALLTGLLGYLLVVAGLIVDLGRPYNVWRPLVHWQYHSPLWEVGCCVAIYSTVLFIEFLPIVLEKVNKYEIVTSRLPTVSFYRFLSKIGIVFIILGVVLSTLHQSSLGTMWVMIPEKLHQLWYSLYLPFFFWLSAIAAGLVMTIVESTLSSKAFKRGLELDLLADLAKGTSIVLAIYLAAKVADLVVRDAWPLLFQPSLEATFFWAEIGLGVIVPAILFAIPSMRRRPGVLFGGAVLVVVFGIILNRLNINLVGMWSYTGLIYFPSWMEIVVTLSLISIGVIAFALAAKYLPNLPGRGGAPILN